MKSHDRSHDGRGRHRRAGSPEARMWQALERDLDSLLHHHGSSEIRKIASQREKRKTAPNPGEVSSQREKTERKRQRKPSKPLGPAPARPPWMDDGEYAALVELREQL